MHVSPEQGFMSHEFPFFIGMMNEPGINLLCRDALAGIIDCRQLRKAFSIFRYFDLFPAKIEHRSLHGRISRKIPGIPVQRHILKTMEEETVQNHMKISPYHQHRIPVRISQHGLRHHVEVSPIAAIAERDLICFMIRSIEPHRHRKQCPVEIRHPGHDLISCPLHHFCCQSFCLFIRFHNEEIIPGSGSDS